MLGTSLLLGLFLVNSRFLRLADGSGAKAELREISNYRDFIGFMVFENHVEPLFVGRSPSGTLDRVYMTAHVGPAHFH